MDNKELTFVVAFNAKTRPNWYLLSNVRDMMEIENNVPQSIDMHIVP